MRKTCSTTLFLIAGFLVGLIVIVGVSAVILMIYTGTTRPAFDKMIQTQPITAPFPEKLAVMITATPSPLGEFQSIVDQAEYEIGTGNAGKVEPLIRPWLKKLENPQQLAAAYRLLGEAEDSQGQSRFAAAYYLMMYENEKTVANLFTLTAAYERGGQWARAYKYYEVLLRMPEASSHYEEIQEHLVELKDTCRCTPEP